MWKYNYSNELYHHGILGMKWGVRRYQNEDGSLTPAGEKRYGVKSKIDTATKKVKEKAQQIEEDYAKDLRANNPFLTKEEARKSAKSTIKAVAFIGGVAGATAIGFGIYYATKHAKAQADEIIKADTPFYHVAGFKDFNSANKELIYIANQKDSNKYVGLYGKQMIWQGSLKDDKLYQTVYKTSDEFKIAGHKIGKEVYDDLIKNDKEFKAKVESGLHALGRTRTDYKNFNIMLVGRNNPSVAQASPSLIGAIDKYTEALSKKGYSGIKDYNDEFKSGYDAAAKILFNDSTVKRGLSFVSEKEYSISDIEAEAGKQYVKLFGRQLIKDSPKVAVGTGLVGASVVVSANRAKNRTNQIAAMKADGKTNKEIAKKLGISESTVSKYINEK